MCLACDREPPGQLHVRVGLRGGAQCRMSAIQALVAAWAMHGSYFVALPPQSHADAVHDVLAQHNSFVDGNAQRVLDDPVCAREVAFAL